MIEYVDEKQDILKSLADIIVIPVNTMGITGKGLALQLHKLYPDVAGKYRKACDYDHKTGTSKFNVKSPMFINANRKGYGYDWVTFCMLATKTDWKKPSDYSYIYQGLGGMKVLLATSNVSKTMKIAFPKIGCGEGCLSWPVVNRMIKKAFEDYEYKITIYGEDEVEDEPTIACSSCGGPTSMSGTLIEQPGDESSEIDVWKCLACGYENEVPARGYPGLYELIQAEKHSLDAVDYGDDYDQENPALYLSEPLPWEIGEPEEVSQEEYMESEAERATRSNEDNPAAEEEAFFEEPVAKPKQYEGIEIDPEEIPF
jgi:O-acetyl-ADP-ribose deacetylase (regulator of RNase III)